MKLGDVSPGVCVAAEGVNVLVGAGDGRLFSRLETRSIIRRFPGLEVLKLGTLGVQAVDLVVERCPQLRTLDIRFDPDVGEGFSGLASLGILTQLRHLGLNMIQVGEANVSAIATASTKLESLTLEGGTLTSGAADALCAGLQNIKRLDLRKIDIPFDAVEKIGRETPSLVGFEFTPHRILLNPAEVAVEFAKRKETYRRLLVSWCCPRWPGNLF